MMKAIISILLICGFFGCGVTACKQPTAIDPTKPVEVVATPTPAPKPVATPTPAPAAGPLPKLAWDGKHPDAKKWTEFLMKELKTIGADMVASKPADLVEFCPKYVYLDQSQREEFYAQLISKLIQYESSYDPAAYMYECSKKANNYGKDARWDEQRGWCMKGGSAKDNYFVVSRGLGQMSLESAQGYKCPVTEPKELHDPYKNLDCMVRVMNRFIPVPRQYEGAVRGHGRIAGKVDGVNKGAAAYWSPMRKYDAEGKIKASYSAIQKYTTNLPICKI